MAGNCSKCNGNLEYCGEEHVNYCECTKCGYKWSTIEKNIKEFCFDKCPKCSKMSLECGSDDQRMCKDCRWLWTCGQEEDGQYDTTDGECAKKDKSNCSGCCGCCKKDVEVEKKDPTKTSSCPGGCCGKGGCCGGGGGCCCGGGCCGGCCKGKGKQMETAKPASEASAGGGGPLWFVIDIANTLSVAVPL